MFAVAVGLPLLVAVGTYAGASIVAPSLRPSVAARFLTLTTLAASFALGWVLVLTTFASAAQLHGIAEFLAWCSEPLGQHTETPTPLGLGAAVLLISALFTARRAQRCQRRARAPRGASGVEIVDSEVPLAYALPGSPGQIVVSSAMLDFLDADEQRVLMAHEQAHLDHHHHRYVRIGEIAAAAFPVLGPLAKRIRLATERWADEIAASAVGDRRLVAHAVANAALAQPEARPGILGMSDSGVVERVAALLLDPPARRRLAEVLATSVVVVSLAVLVGSFIQAHHWIVRVLSLCVPGT